MKQLATDKVPEELHINEIYMTSLYFIVTTSTTVGYGDYGGGTMWERVFLMITEFIGICMFSIMSSQTETVIFMPKMKEIVNNKVSDIKQYL